LLASWKKGSKFLFSGNIAWLIRVAGVSEAGRIVKVSDHIPGGKEGTKKIPRVRKTLLLDVKGERGFQVSKGAG